MPSEATVDDFRNAGRREKHDSNAGLCVALNGWDGWDGMGWMDGMDRMDGMDGIDGMDGMDGMDLCSTCDATTLLSLWRERRCRTSSSHLSPAFVMARARSWIVRPEPK